MTLDFNCQSCDGSFELEIAEVLEGKLQCPSCDVKAPREIFEAVSTALDELFSSLARLQKKFTVTFAVESDDLPVPYDGGNTREAAADDDEVDDDDLDADGDDDDLDDDDDLKDEEDEADL